MKSPRKLYRCRIQRHAVGRSRSCPCIGRQQCESCKGEDVYVLQPRKRKAVRK